MNFETMILKNNKNVQALLSDNHVVFPYMFIVSFLIAKHIHKSPPPCSKLFLNVNICLLNEHMLKVASQISHLDFSNFNVSNIMS